MTMDEKQLDALQRAVQWVVDYQQYLDSRREADRDDPPVVTHHQGYWGLGSTDGNKYEGPLQFASGLAWLGELKPQLLCTSACCLAGDVVMNNGDQMIAFEDEGVTPQSTDWCMDQQGKVHTIPTRAQELLGITSEEATWLFSGKNSRMDIVEIAKMLAKRYDHVLELVV
jgi:hypothetical protein